tara:strand:- start:238 stop:351 length:114 start_codon:yes stop_codon:yes gene_type:complete
MKAKEHQTILKKMGVKTFYIDRSLGNSQKSTLEISRP